MHYFLPISICRFWYVLCVNALVLSSKLLMVVETARAHASVTSNLMECYEAVGTALDSFHSVVICVCVFLLLLLRTNLLCTCAGFTIDTCAVM